MLKLSLDWKRTYNYKMAEIRARQKLVAQIVYGKGGWKDVDIQEVLSMLKEMKRVSTSLLKAYSEDK